MAISVFLSRPTPHEEGQQVFLKKVQQHLRQRGLVPRTIGYTDYGQHPMPHIRSVMMDCNGLIGVAFRRFEIRKGVDRPKNVVTDNQYAKGDERMDGQWLTTPYLHLEAAIAFALGLPILLFVEEGVRLEGALENGVVSTYPMFFDSTDEEKRKRFFASDQWRQLVDTWEGEVREVVHTKGQPPRLYHR